MPDLQVVCNWDNKPEYTSDLKKKVLVIHAGSGRQLPEVIQYCRHHQIPLIQASTGVKYSHRLPSPKRFVLLDAPNLSIPIVKLIYALAKIGYLFKDYDMQIAESHQQTKKSAAGTAIHISKSLGRDPKDITSVRDPHIQRLLLGVSQEHLSRHAIHIIGIEEGTCRITLKTEVNGTDSYLAGLKTVIKEIDSVPYGRYLITDLIDRAII